MVRSVYGAVGVDQGSLGGHVQMCRIDLIWILWHTCTQSKFFKVLRSNNNILSNIGWYFPILQHWFDWNTCELKYDGFMFAK